MTKSGKAKSASTPEPSGDAADVGVAVVSATKRYPMYRIVELSSEGAFLGGKLLLEQGEALTLELSRAGDEPTELRATVVSVEAGASPGIRVAWSELDDSGRAYLSRCEMKSPKPDGKD